MHYLWHYLFKCNLNCIYYCIHFLLWQIKCFEWSRANLHFICLNLFNWQVNCFHFLIFDWHLKWFYLLFFSWPFNSFYLLTFEWTIQQLVNFHFILLPNRLLFNWQFHCFHLLIVVTLHLTSSSSIYHTILSALQLTLQLPSALTFEWVLTSENAISTSATIYFLTPTFNYLKCFSCKLFAASTPTFSSWRLVFSNSVLLVI